MNKEVNQVGVDEQYTEDGAFFTAIGSACTERMLHTLLQKKFIMFPDRPLGY